MLELPEWSGPTDAMARALELVQQDGHADGSKALGRGRSAAVDVWAGKHPEHCDGALLLVDPVDHSVGATPRAVAVIEGGV